MVELSLFGVDRTRVRLIFHSHPRSGPMLTTHRPALHPSCFLRPCGSAERSKTVNFESGESPSVKLDRNWNFSARAETNEWSRLFRELRKFKRGEKRLFFGSSLNADTILLVLIFHQQFHSVADLIALCADLHESPRSTSGVKMRQTSADLNWWTNAITKYVRNAKQLRNTPRACTWTLAIVQHSFFKRHFCHARE